MKIGPKYKIARRLNAPVFEKTQTQKFAARKERKGKSTFAGNKSEYALQQAEKQKARMVYGVTEKQFKNYVTAATAKHKASAAPAIYAALETRLDNAVYRAGFASTRRAARQMVSHGHFTVNGVRSTTPSQHIRVGDMIAVRAGSRESSLFRRVQENSNALIAPEWMAADPKNMSFEVKSQPKFTTDTLFDLNAVVEFYSR